MYILQIPTDIFTSICMDFWELECCQGTDGNAATTFSWFYAGYPATLSLFLCQKAGLTTQCHFWHKYSRKNVFVYGIAKRDRWRSGPFNFIKKFPSLCDMLGIEQHFSIIGHPSQGWG
jgi:hypothetical protein